MPKFSQQSLSQLSSCDLDLQKLFFEVIKYFDCKVLEGYRNEMDQEKAFQAGNTKLHYPHGKHNHKPSLAVDVAPYPINWSNTKRFYYFGGFVLGVAKKLKEEGKMTHGIRWGGDWDGDNIIDDQTFMDLVHFELIV